MDYGYTIDMLQCILKKSPVTPILYNANPYPTNTYTERESRRDWVDSLETYQNAARKEFELMKANHRRPQYKVVLKYSHELFNWQIIARWKELRKRLREQGVIAYVVIEITTRNKRLDDGTRRYFPINKCHYHLFVETRLTGRQLERIKN